MSETKQIPKNARGTVMRPSICPLQRYRMIAKMAYYRALERGFPPGNPVADWLEAERTVDDKYALDFSKLLVTPHVAGLFELLNRLLKAHGVPPIDVNMLVQRERENVAALTCASANVCAPVKTAVSRQVQILADALEAVLARFELLIQVQGPAGPFAAEHGKLLIDLGERTLANLRESLGASVQASIENLELLKARVVQTLGVLKNLAEGFAERGGCPSPRVSPRSPKSAAIQQALDPAYTGSGLRELATAPVSALRGLSESDAQMLREALGIRTIEDLAKNKHFNRAFQIQRLAQTEAP